MHVTTVSFSEASGWSDPLPGPDSERTLVVAFGAPEFGEGAAPLEDLLDAFPRSHVVGCSTAGEFIGTELRDHSVVAAVVRFERTSLRSAAATVRSPADSSSAGESIARRLADPSLRAVLVFSDGLIVNGSELVRGLDAVLDSSVVVTGGLAADGPRFEHTWTLDGDGAHAGVVCAVGLYGEAVRIGHGSRGGWDSFGPERTITRSRGNVLYELDGRPALDLYREYLGELASELPSSGLLFPLAVRGDTDEAAVVRTILAIDDPDQALVFAGDMPEGSRAQLMRANFDRLIEGAAGAAHMARAGGDAGGQSLALGISCVGRRLVLGERAEEEIEATLDALPPGAHQIGFYSYGEISPHGLGSCELHNQTMTLTTIHERPG